MSTNQNDSTLKHILDKNLMSSPTTEGAQEELHWDSDSRSDGCNAQLDDDIYPNIVRETEHECKVRISSN